MNKKDRTIIVITLILGLIVSTIFYIYSPYLDFLKVKSTAQEPEKLIVQPASYKVICNSEWSTEFLLKITNNYDYALYDLMLEIYPNSSESSYVEILPKDLEPYIKGSIVSIDWGFFCLEGLCGENKCEFCKINAINPGQTLTFDILAPKTKCNEDFDIFFHITNHSNETSITFSKNKI